MKGMGEEVCSLNLFCSLLSNKSYKIIPWWDASCLPSVVVLGKPEYHSIKAPPAEPQKWITHICNECVCVCLCVCVCVCVGDGWMRRWGLITPTIPICFCNTNDTLPATSWLRQFVCLCFDEYGTHTHTHTHTHTRCHHEPQPVADSIYQRSGGILVSHCFSRRIRSFSFS